jgi:polyhydroxyalkanoate synthase
MNTPKKATTPNPAKLTRALHLSKGTPQSLAQVSNKHAEDVSIKTISRKHAAGKELAEDFKPEPLSSSFQDWLVGLLEDPRNLSLVRERIGQTVRDLPSFINHLEQAIKDVPLGPIKPDHRYQDDLWKGWPFNIYSQSFLHLKHWWTKAFSTLPGEHKHQMTMVHFATLQFIESMSPANFMLTNPELIARTIKEGGANLVRGQGYLLEDSFRSLFKLPAKGFEKFVVGKDVAITPGKVVYKDDLMELIQYTPSTQSVKAEPILIVPAWIMKYYILDLSPDNSMIKYLVDQGHTVFAISWKNPTSEDRYMGLEDYLNLGVLGALDQINQVCPGQKVNAVGYCLGGTLLSIAAAKMGRDKDDRLASITLLAAQTDFSEPGNIGMFIDQAKVGFIESLMRPSGYLDSAQMSSAFQMIGSADRKWAQMTKEYILGDRSEPNDLMAWNADGTRLSIRMHSQYLHHMYLNNDLAKGRYKVGDQPIHLEDITCPVFGVGTAQDFVAPWRSVYKLHHHVKTPIEFVLTSGGHNAGIVSPPGLKHRNYQFLTRVANGKYISPDEWVNVATHAEGSWWEHWTHWLDQHSTQSVKPPSFPKDSSASGKLVDAPGEYVFH